MIIQMLYEQIITLALPMKLNSILMHLDQSDPDMSIVFDLSDDFDTICHGVLLNIREKWCGIKRTTLTFCISKWAYTKQVTGNNECSIRVITFLSQVLLLQDKFKYNQCKVI